jgi:hypothetical protein
MTYATVVRRPAAAAPARDPSGNARTYPAVQRSRPAAVKRSPRGRAAGRCRLEARLSHKSLCKGLRQQPVGRAASDAKLFDLQVG